MKYLLNSFFFILLFGVQISLGQNNTEVKFGKSFSIQSNILNEERTCLISFPESYNDSTKTKEKYPVIILLDGSAHFRTVSGIVHFMSSDRNRNFLMPKAIIISIENVDRERDFTVTKIKTKRVNTMGGGKKFLDFIEKELIPYADKNYRTKPFRTLIGHSLGGLLTLNSYMDENSIFNAFLAIDPSMWWSEPLMTKKVDSIPSPCFNKKLYIASANWGESRNERNKDRHNMFYTLLKKRAKKSLNTKIDYFEKRNHRSVPLEAIFEGLIYLFDDDR